VSFSVSYVCICVLNYCHRVATQLQLNISYHIISHYHIIYHITSYHITSYYIIYISYHIIYIILYITSYHIVSYIISYITYNIASYHIISYHITSYHIIYHIIYYIISHNMAVNYCRVKRTTAICCNKKHRPPISELSSKRRDFGGIFFANCVACIFLLKFRN
jgi:hypothetical protein